MPNAVTRAYNTVVSFVNERILRRTIAPAVEIVTLADPPGLAKGRQVNLFLDGWTELGGTTRVPRYSVDIEFVWTDYQGVDHQWQGTKIFPDDLLALGVEEIKERVQDWLVEVARAEAGVDV